MPPLNRIIKSVILKFLYLSPFQHKNYVCEVPWMFSLLQMACQTELDYEQTNTFIKKAYFVRHGCKEARILPKQTSKISTGLFYDTKAQK